MGREGKRGEERKGEERIGKERKGKERKREERRKQIGYLGGEEGSQLKVACAL